MRFLAPILIGCGCIAGAACAADLDPPPASSPPSSGPRWDGPYLGFNAGAVWAPGNSASTSWFDDASLYADPALLAKHPQLANIPASSPPNSAFGFSPFGLTGGLQIGFNKQFGMLVFGVEADYDLMHAKSTSTGSGIYSGATLGGAPFSNPYTISQSQSLQSLGTFRAKLGFTPMDDLLVYATGGLAAGDTQSSSNIVISNGSSFSGTRGNLAVGYAVGGGVEYALDRNWSVRADALYFDLGHSAVVGIANFDIPALQSDTVATFKGYTLRLGLNYEFDGEDGGSTGQEPAQNGALQDIKLT